MAKLSEIFKDITNKFSKEQRGKCYMNEYDRQRGSEDGCEYTLDNLVPKIAIDFAIYCINRYNYVGDNKFTNKEIYKRGKNPFPTSEELFQEFLKDYKG